MIWHSLLKICTLNSVTVPYTDVQYISMYHILYKVTHKGKGLNLFRFNNLKVIFAFLQKCSSLMAILKISHIKKQGAINVRKRLNKFRTIVSEVSTFVGYPAPYTFIIKQSLWQGLIFLCVSVPLVPFSHFKLELEPQQLWICVHSTLMCLMFIRLFKLMTWA